MKQSYLCAKNIESKSCQKLLSKNGGKQADVTSKFLYFETARNILTTFWPWAITQNVQYVIWVLVNAFTNYFLANVHYVHYN